MSTSKVVTRADLKAVLDEVLPPICETKYVKGTTLDGAGLIAGYTAPEAGFAVYRVAWDTQSVTGYSYVLDETDNIYVAMLTTNKTDGLSQCVTIDLVKGHTYKLVNQSNVYYCTFDPYTEVVCPPITPTTADYIVEQGTSGIWTYRKWNSGKYHAWYENSVNFQAGSAWLGGYFHQTTSALTPPSFSQSVTSLTGQPNSDQLCIYCGHASDYSTYWLDAISTTRNNIPVRLDMYGRWK